MKVTEKMTTEAGGSMLKLCDYLGVDDTGIKVTQDGEHVRIEAGAGEYPSKSVWLEPEDALGVAWLLIEHAVKVRGRDPELLKRAWQAARNRAADIAVDGIMDDVMTGYLADAFRDIDAMMGQP